MYFATDADGIPPVFVYHREEVLVSSIHPLRLSFQVRQRTDKQHMPVAIKRQVVLLQRSRIFALEHTVLLSVP